MTPAIDSAENARSNDDAPHAVYPGCRELDRRAAGGGLVMRATLFSLVCFFLCVMPAAHERTLAADAPSPLGLWKTVDDKTGAPRALVRIYLEDGKYFGRIEQSFTPGAQSRVCAVCNDERKDQPIVGLVIIRNVTLHDGEFTGGDILDPDSGTVYRCKFHLENGGNTLVVRGFIGFSLLGRSQTWSRQT